MSALVRFAAFSLLTVVPGQPACWYPSSRIGGAMAARKAKRMSAQVVEDEDYQLRHELPCVNPFFVRRRLAAA